MLTLFLRHCLDIGEGGSLPSFDSRKANPYSNSTFIRLNHNFLNLSLPSETVISLRVETMPDSFLHLQNLAQGMKPCQGLMHVCGFASCPLWKVG